MKLDANEVVAIRALSDVGFSTRSIARVYGMTHRQIWSIARFQSWAFLPPSSGALPELLREQVALLRLRRRFDRLPAEQRQRVEVYAQWMAAMLKVQESPESNDRGADLTAPELLQRWERTREVPCQTDEPTTPVLAGETVG